MLLAPICSLLTIYWQIIMHNLYIGMYLGAILNAILGAMLAYMKDKLSSCS